MRASLGEKGRRRKRKEEEEDYPVEGAPPSASVFLLSSQSRSLSLRLPLASSRRSQWRPAVTMGGQKDKLSKAQIEQYRKVFNEYDTSGDDSIDQKELQALLNSAGFRLTKEQIQKLWEEVDEDGSGEISFDEFIELVSRLREYNKDEYRVKNVPTPRLFLDKRDLKKYTAVFEQRSGGDGKMDMVQLDAFFQTHNIQVSPERLANIMAEVDEDSSGYLDMNEFLVLLIKFLGLRRRPVGPGQCELSRLIRTGKDGEGWSFSEAKKAGYNAKHFLESGVRFDDICPGVFALADFRKAGVTPYEMREAGWRGVKGRESGYTMDELLQAGFSIASLRKAGYSEVFSAVELRRLGVPAKAMKAGGWTLSDLKRAGYSGVELRTAGFSTKGLEQMRRSLLKEAGVPTGQSEEGGGLGATASNPLGRWSTLKRCGTFSLRREIDEANPPPKFTGLGGNGPGGWLTARF